MKFVMRRFFSILAGLLLITLCSGSRVFAADPDWKLKKESDGIQIYTRKSEGSPVNQFKGRMSVKAPLDKVRELFEDTPHVTDWTYQCKVFKELNKKSDSERTFYLRQHL